MFRTCTIAYDKFMVASIGAMSKYCALCVIIYAKDLRLCDRINTAQSSVRLACKHD